MYRGNGQADQSRAPALPEGFPPEMFRYRQFAEMYGWTPGQVRALTVAELRWLPVLREAVQEAAETLADKTP